MAGYMQVSVVGDTADVQAMLMKLNTALLPTGIGAYLNTVVDPWLRQRASERFTNEGDDVVGKWLPLTAFTQQVRSDQGYGAAHPINRRTGQMENYILHAGSRVEMTAAGATLTYPGSDVSGELEEKVRTAQVGITNRSNVTPPRPVLGVGVRDLEFVLVGLAKHIQGTP